MNLKEALTISLNRKLNNTQDADTLINSIDLDYDLPSREYEIVYDIYGTKYFKTLFEDKEYDTEIEIYFSIIKGSILDENYNDYSVLIEEYLMGTRDYECISYFNYRLDGVIEKHKVYCNEEKSEEPLLKRINKLRIA